MNLLYKYCDPSGIVKILQTLELKLPYISQVNDPLECLPFFYCPDDKAAIEKRYVWIMARRGLPPEPAYRQALDASFQKGEIQKGLAESSRKLQKDWNEKSCLLSVSKTPRNTVMWAHYGDAHVGAVVGIDFDDVLPETDGPRGLLMHAVRYSKQRPKVNILTDFDGGPEVFLQTILTKSIDWEYEQEFRAVILDSQLMQLRQKSLTRQREFSNRQTWFLRLNPKSIREIVFGLYAQENLKSAVRELTGRSELQHVKLYQAEASETYELNLKGVENR